MQTRFSHLAPALVLAALALALRCYSLSAPLLDYHSWRQADTAAIARNYTQNGYRFLFPQVDWGGQTPGYVESEFPLYSYTLALLFGLFGAQAWVGRALTALAGAAAAGALYELVYAASGNRRVAVYAGLALALMPFPLYFGRTVMPDTWMLLAAILALWSFQRWVAEPSTGHYVVALLCGALAPLAKTPNLLIAGVPLAYLALMSWPRLVWHAKSPETKTKNQVRRGGSRFSMLGSSAALLLLYGLVFTLPSLVWMRHAQALPLDPRLSFGIGEKLFDLALLGDPQFYILVARWSVENIVTWAGAPVFLLGLLPTTGDRRPAASQALHSHLHPLLPYTWLFGVLLFLLAAASGVVGQDYYILPLAGPAAWLVGRGLERAQRLLETSDERRATSGEGQATAYVRPWSFVIRRRWASYLVPACVLALLAGLSLLRIAPLYRTADFYATLGRRVDLALPEGQRLGVIAPAVSEILFYGGRKGWRLDPGVLVPGGLDSLPPDQGVRYLLVTDPMLTEQRALLTTALRQYRRVPLGPYALLLDLERPGLEQPAEMIWQTGHLVESPFLEYWLQAGGPERYGLPLSEAFEGIEGREQFFERALLLHNKRGVKRLSVGRLLLESAGQTAQPAEVTGAWQTAWRQAGGEKGLGAPLSPPLETNGRVIQYFEFGILEAQPGGEPAVGAAGRALLEARGLTEERQIELLRSQ
jgi:hypothetical protein